MKPDAFAGAKPAGFPKGRGQILGTGLGRVERWTYAAKATKKAICWPFLKPSNGLEPLAPSYHRVRKPSPTVLQPTPDLPIRRRGRIGGRKGLATRLAKPK